MHRGTLKKCYDEKHLNENVNRIVKIDEKNMRKTESTSSDWNENIVTVINIIVSTGSRSKAYNLIKVLLREKYITMNENYATTYLKTGMNISYKIFMGNIFYEKKS